MHTAYCHKSPENMKLIRGNAKWLWLPQLNLLSECPTHWNSFMKSAARMVKIKDPLNVTMKAADREDILLLKSEYELLKELVHELEDFNKITNMLSANTEYTFNNYLPMKTLIENKLDSKEFDEAIFHRDIIKDFRKEMCIHFKKFNPPEKIMNLAKMAPMLCPINMIRCDEADLIPFVDQVLEMFE